MSLPRGRHYSSHFKQCSGFSLTDSTQDLMRRQKKWKGEYLQGLVEIDTRPVGEAATWTTLIWADFDIDHLTSSPLFSALQDTFYFCQEPQSSYFNEQQMSGMNILAHLTAFIWQICNV